MTGALAGLVLLVSTALALVFLVTFLSRAAAGLMRPGEGDLYCCLCDQWRPCGSGCCHRSCADHAVVRFREEGP